MSDVMQLDFMDRLRGKINELDVFATCNIGILGAGESLSIMAMPGGAETVYFDGIRDKDYQVQVNAKSRNQLNCFDSLTLIYQTLENLIDLPSENGSYDFQSISVPNLPNLVVYDEQGFFIYALSLSAKITIYKGVDIVG